MNVGIEEDVPTDDGVKDQMAMVKKILTIDGGGIRGAFAAAIIEQIERVVGKPAKEIFDCFYGTSTGAILATGLASGMSAVASPIRAPPGSSRYHPSLKASH